MKKTLCLILAALLLASSMTACGKTEPTETTAQTNAPETNAPATQAPATDAPETNAPAPQYPYDTTLVTENGVAKAHIVVAEGADALLGYAAEELQYHIKKVTGADISVTTEVLSDSLPIIIATPDSMPELETLFPEELAWLRDIGAVGDTERWGEDGFAIRTYEGKIYIFGAVAKGALNGTYDFIEENMGVLWTRADESIGLIFDEMPTVTVVKTDYKEKSPFAVRGWHLCGYADYNDNRTARMLARNKINFKSGGGYEPYGIDVLAVAHNVKSLVKNSPIYDPNETDYWSTSPTGEHTNYENSIQINFWSEKAVEAVAASIIKKMKEGGKYYNFIGIEDYMEGTVYPEDTLPFEYAPGEFVYPGELDYYSTVYFTFVNKVARIVKEECPDQMISTFAYAFVTCAPACKLEDNICVVFCSIDEDLSAPRGDEFNDLAYLTYTYQKNWEKSTNNIVNYTYYGTNLIEAIYERPIWNRIQADLQYYAECGFTGVQPEAAAGGDDNADLYVITVDGNRQCGVGHKNSDVWTMSALTYWLYNKLAWNPYEDVDALIKLFCDKSYGDASEYMQEYYRLIEAGFEEGAALGRENGHLKMKWFSRPEVYWDNFIDNFDFVENEGLLEKIRAALHNAYDAADDVEKQRIEYIMNCYDIGEELFIQ